MKIPLPGPTAALILGLLLTCTSAFADDPLATRMASSLDQAIGLSPSQKAQVIQIWTTADTAMRAIPQADRPAQGAPIRRNALAQVRALLTPAQQKKFDLTSQTQGGGLTTMSPEQMLARLDLLVTLTPAEKQTALAVFQEEVEALMALPPKTAAPKGWKFGQR